MAHLQTHEGITLHALVGVFEWERKAVRPLIFDLRLESELPLPLTRESVKHQLGLWLAPTRYRLLEALAEYLTQRMFAAWPCTHITLSIEKPGALGTVARVGVRIERWPKHKSIC